MTITNIQNSTLNLSFVALLKWHDPDTRMTKFENHIPTSKQIGWFFQIFVAFLKYMNFNQIERNDWNSLEFLKYSTTLYPLFTFFFKKKILYVFWVSYLYHKIDWCNKFHHWCTWQTERRKLIKFELRTCQWKFKNNWIFEKITI